LAVGLTAVAGKSLGLKNALANWLEVRQVWPTGREFHQHATAGLTNAGGHLDQPRAPSARLAFAQRIMFVVPVMPVTASVTSASFIGQFLPRKLRRWIGDDLPCTNQEVIGGGVQIKPETIGEVAVIAETVGLAANLSIPCCGPRSRRDWRIRHSRRRAVRKLPAGW